MSDTGKEQSGLDGEIDRLLQDSRVRQLTPLQAVFTRMTWVIVFSLILSVGFIAWAWVSKLPAVPPLNATAEEISHYRELTDIANDNVTHLVETVIAKVLFPLLTLVAGISVGRFIGPKKDDE